MDVTPRKVKRGSEEKRGTESRVERRAITIIRRKSNDIYVIREVLDDRLQRHCASQTKQRDKYI